MDTVNFKTLPDVLQTQQMAHQVGALQEIPETSHDACGSPGEVENDPALGHRYGMYISNTEKDPPHTDPPNLSRGDTALLLSHHWRALTGSL